MRINSVWFFFSYNFTETLDKQREIGGEAFIAKSKEATKRHWASDCFCYSDLLVTRL